MLKKTLEMAWFFSAEVLPKKHEKNMTWVQILSNPAEDVI